MDKPMSQQTINKKYKQLGLSKETVELLHRYFTAFANFYGIINFSDAYSIIDKQNPDLITFEKLYEFSNIVERETTYYYIVDRNEMYPDTVATPETREIVASYLLDVNDQHYFDLSGYQQGKPIFVPSKEELLKHEDEFYYEETPSSKALEKFFARKRIIGERFLDVMAEIVSSVIFDDGTIDDAFYSLASLGIELTDAEVIRFGNLYCDFANNFRIPANRGYTPKELNKLSAKTNNSPEIILSDNAKEFIRSGKLSGADFMNSVIASDLPLNTKKDLLKQVSEISGSSTPQKPISKNAPCPCGSGKKYKRCCGKDITIGS